MKIGFRIRLFFGFVILTLAVVLFSGVYLQRSLRAWVIERAHSELGRHAETSSLLLESMPGHDTVERIDPIADRISAATNAEVEIIDAAGRHLGDSRRDVAALNALAPLSAEELARWRGAIASAPPRKLSSDVVVIVREWRHDEATGLLRLSLPVSEIEALFEKVRLLILFAALLGLGAAVLMSWLSSNLMSRMLQSLVEHVRALARGAGSKAEPAELAEPGGIALSITRLAEELARRVEDLARERDRFETVLESMNEAIIALDSQHRVKLINRAAQELFPRLDVFGGEFEGQRVTSLLKVPALLDLLEDASVGKRSTAELTLPGAQQRRVMAHINPSGSGDGGSVLVMHDVTELRKLETVRRDFVANVSHELRTPVAVIMLNAETLMGDEDLMKASKHAPRFIEALHRNADRLSRLISDLLDISRLEAGRFKLTLEPVSVFGATLRVMDALEEKALAKKQTLDTDISADLLAFADSKALDQMLFNLIDNAIKYAPEEGSILVRAERVELDLGVGERGFVRIEICDDGPGLPAHHRPRIFERFYRVDDGRSRDVGGTGLGLAIVKHLAGAMEGRVGVKPNEPRGSIFWIRLREADPEDQIEIDMASALDILPPDE